MTSGLLHVVVKEGRSLPGSGTSVSRPYVTLAAGPSVRRSGTAFGNPSAPQWNTTFSVPLTQDTNQLQVAVYDDATPAGAPPLGYASIDLRHVVGTGMPTQGWYTLYSTSGIPAGQIFLSILHEHEPPASAPARLYPTSPQPPAGYPAPVQAPLTLPASPVGYAPVTYAPAPVWYTPTAAPVYVTTPPAVIAAPSVVYVDDYRRRYGRYGGGDMFLAGLTGFALGGLIF